MAFDIDFVLEIYPSGYDKYAMFPFSKDTVLEVALPTGPVPQL